MEGVVVAMGIMLFILGAFSAFLFPMMGMGGRHSVRVSRGHGNTVITALGLPMSMALLGVVTTVIGMYLP